VRPSTLVKPRQFIANAPLQVLTWDITYLRHAHIRGGYFYLYLFIGIWSRRIVGAEVYDIQSAELAADLLGKVCCEHGIQADSTGPGIAKAVILRAHATETRAGGHNAQTATNSVYWK
jgi:transposase InsO family protein